MNLLEVINRKRNPRPWVGGGKIPWDDPAFSKRMLREHLSQAHDAASRRRKIIQQQVGWIHSFIIKEKPARILDLGCGPGLYAKPLTDHGHSYHGIDFAPAAIEYARQHSPKGCTYTHGDVRTTAYGRDYDLVMFIFGEFNVFHPRDARRILHKAREALRPGGQLLLEVSTLESLYDLGNQPCLWYTDKIGPFSDQPYLCMLENFWDEKGAAVIERYFILETGSSHFALHASCSKAYTEAQFRQMLHSQGFNNIHFHPSLTGGIEADPDGLMVILAQKVAHSK